MEVYKFNKIKIKLKVKIKFNKNISKNKLISDLNIKKNIILSRLENTEKKIIELEKKLKDI